MAADTSQPQQSTQSGAEQSAGGENGSQGQNPAAAAEEERKPMNPRLLSAVVQLEMKPLWDEFHELGTEMIVTKAGRYMIHQYL